MTGSPPADAYLFEQLDYWAKTTPDDLCLRFVRDLSGTTESFSYAAVQGLARAGAAAYRAAGLQPGDRVLLDLPTDEHFVAAILGAFHLGLTPASVAPLEQRRGAAAELDWMHHVESLAPAAIVSRGNPPACGLPVLLPEELSAGDPEAAGPRAPQEQVRYVQYSSGSTGSPKALQLNMEGITFNLFGMHRQLPFTKRDHTVAWLPMYHDMGLFGTLLLALQSGGKLTLMDPSLFSRSPLLWFKMIEQEGATLTVGPPSAFKAAFELLKRRPPESLDLSTCRLWICGSEQVTPELIELFHETIVPYGAPPEALKPVYGMAEITLAATMCPFARGQVFAELDRETFEKEKRAVAPIAGQPTLRWTGVGSMMDGQACRIVDDAGQELADNHVGRIELQSPSLFAGTLDRGVFSPRAGAWHDTGDLGFRRGDELFITGRSRELIIKNGRNYVPERIEEMAMTVGDTGRAAAFGVFDPRRQTERAIVMLEVHPRAMADAAKRDATRLAVRKTLAEAGYEIDEAILVARGSLPRTTSGKIRRTACRAQYLSDSEAAQT